MTIPFFIIPFFVSKVVCVVPVAHQHPLFILMPPRGLWRRCTEIRPVSLCFKKILQQRFCVPLPATLGPGTGTASDSRMNEGPGRSKGWPPA